MAVKVRMGEKEILQAMKQSVLMLMAACQESEGEDDESDEDDEGARLAIYCTRACCCCRVSLKRVCSKEQSLLICACICTILDPMGLFVRPCVTQR